MLIRTAFDTSEIKVWSGDCWRRYTGGLLHSSGDRPAFIGPYGYCEWYHNGVIHRDGDRPAIIDISGLREWYHYGVLHRDGDRPAISDTNRREWYRYGSIHRGGDRPAMEYGSPELLCMLTAHKWGQRGCKRYARHTWVSSSPRMDTALREWHMDGQYYREGDRPTFEKVAAPIGGCSFGQTYIRRWYIAQGTLHRDCDMPAYIKENEKGGWIRLEWYQRGRLQRGGDRPALVDDTTIKWGEDFSMHRMLQFAEPEKDSYFDDEGSDDEDTDDEDAGIICSNYLEIVWGPEQVLGE